MCLSSLGNSTPRAATGFVIDFECWNKPNHIAIDGADLVTEPEKHTAHCLLLSVCKKSGFFLYDTVGNSTTYTNVGTLDADGNNKMITYLESRDVDHTVYVSLEATVTTTANNAVMLTGVSNIAGKSWRGGDPNSASSNAASLLVTMFAASLFGLILN